MAARTEAEGEVLVDIARGAVATLAEQCAAAGLDVRRVLDLGSGPGVASALLADALPGADVVAVDGSAAMLAAAGARAARLGVAERVSTRRVDLADDLGVLGTADVVWASLVVHHIGDEADALGRIGALLPAGGLLALVEMAEPVRVELDPAALGRPGLWERLDASWREWFAEMRASLPGHTTSADYPSMLDRAGFDVLVDEVRTVTLAAPLGPVARRFTAEQLRGARTRLEGHADPADLAALDALVDDGAATGVMQRDDVGLTASRHLFVARRR